MLYVRIFIYRASRIVLGRIQESEDRREVLKIAMYLPRSVKRTKKITTGKKNGYT